MSWRFVTTLVICATIIAVLVARPQSPAEADHSDGNMPYQVNYWLVDEGQLRVFVHAPAA